MNVGPTGRDGSSAEESAVDDADDTGENDARPERDRGVRASDGERESFAQTVLAAGRDGRLTVEETDHRLGQVYAAKFRDELPELIRDLPREGWPAGFGETPSAEPGRAQTLDPRPRRLPDLPVWNGALTTHVAIVSVLAVMAVLAWTRSGVPFFWPAWPIGWLGVSVLVHYRVRRRRQRWRAAGGGDLRPWGPPGWGPPGWGPPGRPRFDRDDSWRNFRGNRDDPPLA